MGFEKGKRTGKNWEDILFIDSLIKNTDRKSDGSIMNITGKEEREFELRFSSLLDANKKNLNGKLISQQNKDTTVKQIYCFGKKHRPDMAINDDGIAIEIKYISGSFDGIKMALGQSFMYRLRYKFVVNVIVISEDNKTVYEKALNGEEKDIEDILKYLADDMNVFTYIIPAFSLKKNQKRVFEVNGLEKTVETTE
ncbi:MAG: hypothetical protein VZR56_01830 [Treponema sp.]|nr:hypothetical protein [Treponema sp.]MEE3312877.1 hypothetical protein [Treponema sp.]